MPVMRTLLWALAGVVLGGIIHIGVILSLPSLASEGLWARVGTLDAVNKSIVLAAPVAGQPNPLKLDPELTYAVCQINLRNGPGLIRGTLPLSFWSVAVYAPSGAVLYSTTNRDGIGTTLELGIFNAAQTRLLAEQQLNVAEGLLIVESPVDDIAAVVRLAPSHPAARARYEADLSQISCGNLPTT
jgi:uncharacterized membrane protein